MTADEAKTILLQEYTFLNRKKVQIIKQFTSKKGHIYNTFLVKTTKKGFELFVAKSFVYSKESIVKEYNILKLLEDRNILAPRLLVPKHNPKNFLLKTFINGAIATEAVKNESKRKEIFENIGLATGNIHSVILDNFGDFLTPEGLSWKDLEIQTIQNLMISANKIIERPLFIKIQKIIENTKFILLDETRGKPVLCTRDIYLDNFIIDSSTNKTIFIDYGMSIKGRPFFDLARFYIWTLHEYPNQKDTFLRAYAKIIHLPNNFNEILKFYIIQECLGMINFFNNIHEEKYKNHAIQVLDDLSKNKGIIYNLLNK